MKCGESKSSLPTFSVPWLSFCPPPPLSLSHSGLCLEFSVSLTVLVNHYQDSQRLKDHVLYGIIKCISVVS